LNVILCYFVKPWKKQLVFLACVLKNCAEHKFSWCGTLRKKFSPFFSRNNSNDTVKPSASTLANASRHGASAAPTAGAAGGNRLGPVKTSSAMQPRQVPVVSYKTSDVTKRQRSMIRAAVNGNSKALPPDKHNFGTNHLQEFNLDQEHDSKLLETVASGAVVHGLTNGASPSVVQLTQTAAAPTAANYAFSRNSNSDSDLVSHSSPVLGRPGVDFPRAPRGNLNGQSASGVHFDKIHVDSDQQRLPPAGNRPILSRNQTFPSRDPTWNTRPTQSRIPVRATANGASPLKSSKAPSLMYRGRGGSAAAQARTTPPNAVRPSAVGLAPNPSQVVVGAGGVVSVPLSQSPSRFYHGVPGTPHNESLRVPLNGSVYMSNSTAMMMQPLCVSQKPLFLFQREDSRADGSRPGANEPRKPQPDQAPAKLPASKAPGSNRTQQRRNGKSKNGKKKSSSRMSRKTPVADSSYTVATVSEDVDPKSLSSNAGTKDTTFSPSDGLADKGGLIVTSPRFSFGVPLFKSEAAESEVRLFSEQPSAEPIFPEGIGAGAVTAEKTFAEASYTIAAGSPKPLLESFFDLNLD